MHVPRLKLESDSVPVVVSAAGLVTDGALMAAAALLVLAVDNCVAHAPSPAGALALATNIVPPACPVVDGVVDVARCAGFNQTGDSTAALQSALHSQAHTVLIRNLGSPWLVSTTVYLGSNQTVRFSPGATIEAMRWAPFWNDSKAPSKPHPLLSTNHGGSVNVTLQGAPGATLRMHKADYMNKALYPVHNEWRYGLFLSSGSHHIRTFDLTIAAAGGDGICIAYAAHDIHLSRLLLDDNYRNALTISNGKDLLIEDCVFSNTGGTAPSAGVDIEPDWAWSDLSNITFRRCQFLNNSGNGFQMAPGGVRPWNHTTFPGVPQCDREGNNSACPISVSIEMSHIEGRAATRTPCSSPCAFGGRVSGVPDGTPAAVECHLYDCTGCVYAQERGGRACTSTGEMFGISFAGTHEHVPGSFRVSDTTIANTALSGVLVSEKAATGAVFVLSNVTLINTGANLTGYENWIWKTGWLNSPVVIQNDSPAQFGSAGGIVMDRLRVVNDRPRPWLTTYVDPTTRLESITGRVTVETRHQYRQEACSVQAGKPSDRSDLKALELTCSVVPEELSDQSLHRRHNFMPNVTKLLMRRDRSI